MSDLETTTPSTESGSKPPDLLGRWFWVETPVRAAKYGPSLASGLSDGQYFLRWRPLSWLVVVCAFLAGIVTELLQDGEVFSTSWLVIVALSSLGLLSIQLGCYGLIGYIGADLLTGRSVGRGFTREWWAPLGNLLSMLTEYLILAGAVVAVPMLVLALRMELRRREVHKLVGPAGERFVHAVAVVVLYYIWCQSTVSSIRTVYRPVNARIPVDAVFNTQERWHFITGALVLVTVARWFLERASVDERSIVVLRETTERFGAVARQSSPSIYRRLVFQLIVGLLLMGGIVDYLWQVPVTAVVIVAVTLLREAIPRTAAGAIVSRIPLAARFVVAAVLSYLLFSAVAEPSRGSFLRRSDFLAMWGSVLVSYVLVGLTTIRGRVVPADSPDHDGIEPEAATPDRHSWPPPTSAAGCVLALAATGGLAVAVVGFTTSAASADNCSGLTDCWGTSESFLLALGILLLVLGIALILSPAIVLAAPALVTTGGFVIGASVTIPAATLTTAGIGSMVVGTGLIVGTQADDLITLATSDGAGRGDAHGDSGRELSKVEERIRQAQEDLAELNRNQGPKKEKERLKRLIENLRRAAERARKGETHGRQGRGQQN